MNSIIQLLNNLRFDGPFPLHHFHIEHLLYHPPPPPPKKKFCIAIVSNFSWVLKSSQEKWKTKLMPNFGGKQDELRAMWKSGSFLNKGTDSRLGLTKHSDLYEMIIVYPSLDLFSLCVLSLKVYKIFSSLIDHQLHIRLRFRVLLRVNNPSNKCFITGHVTNLFRPTLHLFNSCAWTLLC